MNHDGRCHQPDQPKTGSEQRAERRCCDVPSGAVAFKFDKNLGVEPKLRIELDQVVSALEKREATADPDNPPIILYSTASPWWTHDWTHARSVGKSPPLDPRGAVLLQTAGWRKFIDEAKAKPDHYGKHRLRAFTAAHHLNTVRGIVDRRPWCFNSWDDYNRILDEADQRRSSIRMNQRFA